MQPTTLFGVMTMNDSVRETFEQDYEELHGIAVPESSFKRDETGNYYDPDIAREWIIWSAAWRANGGEAERLRQELADMKRVFNTAMEAAEFPDAHPAPPSVAVPEGVDLDLVSAVLEDYANLQTSGAIPCANRYPASDVNEQAELLDMLTAAPSPDHSGDTNKMVEVFIENQEPLGAEFETVYEENKGELYEFDDDRIADAGKMDDAAVNSMARTLLEAWKKAEPNHSITAHPVSYISTFADMARAAIAAIAAIAASPSVPENEIKARALDEHADSLKAKSDAAMTVYQATILDWAEGYAREQAARLRTAGDEGEGV